jgi:hypothetical protein
VVEISVHERGVIRIALLAVALGSVVACTREVRHFPVPSDAKATVSGAKYIVLREGHGQPAVKFQIWGVEEKLISHKMPDCAYPCTWYMTRPATAEHHDSNRDWLGTMREDEARRVWLTGDDGEIYVYEFTMASVFRTDEHGEPIYEKSAPPRYPIQPYERPRESGTVAPTTT